MIQILIWVNIYFHFLQEHSEFELFEFCFHLENPPLNKDLRKRKREEDAERDEDEEFQPKIFHQNLDGDQDQSEKDSNSSSVSGSDDESPVDKFRRGCDLPSDLDMGDGENSADSSNNEDCEDDGDWNMMGAALEREFLGLD